MVVDGAVVMVENIVRHLSRGRGDKTIPDRIRAAAHEVQRPVFYAIAIIITAYLPIFTLAASGGPAFPAHGLDGGVCPAGSAVIFSMTIAPVLASLLFRKEFREWHNPVMAWLTESISAALCAGLFIIAG